MLKASQPGEPEDMPCEGSGRGPTGDVECAATAEWLEHLKVCVEAQVGHFE